MLCGKLINVQGRDVPCGQCMPCRINKQRMWVGRILLESAHAATHSTFLTLTYSPENEPKDKSLNPDHWNEFNDRLRHRSGIGHVRFFAVGEYGTKTQRPHYHAAIFGVPPTAPYQKIFNETWGQGFITVGLIEKKSAAYIAGYTTKKMTSHDDTRLDGRYPEFSRMSKRPPLGASGMRHIANMMYSKSGSAALAAKQDMPASFRMNGATYPIGKYWHEWLRDELGITNPHVRADWDLDYEQFSRERQNAEKISQKLWQTHKRTKQRQL